MASVVMAVYNGAAYLREAIDSILAQTFDDFEFIIVDDGSKDETPAILRSYDDRRIRIISQDNCGRSAALNRGIMASSGAYVAILDADDVAAKFRIEKEIEFLDHNLNYVIVGGFMEFIAADGQPIYVQTLPTSSDELKRDIRDGKCPLLHSSVMYRRQSATQCGLYNEFLKISEELDFYKRLMLIGEMANLPVCLGQYRLAPGAGTNRHYFSKVRKKRLEVLHRAEQNDLKEKDQSIFSDMEINDKMKDLSIYRLRVGKAFLQHTEDRASARRYLRRAVTAWPCNGPAWYNLLLSYAPPGLRLTLNRLRGTAS